MYKYLNKNQLKLDFKKSLLLTCFESVNIYHIVLISGKILLSIINIRNAKNVKKLSTIWNIPGSADFLSPPIESPDKLVYPIRRKEPVQRMEKLETVYHHNNCLAAPAPNSQERWSSRVGWKPKKFDFNTKGYSQRMRF